MALAPLNAMLVVEREHFRLTLYRRPLASSRFEVARIYPVAVGLLDYKTPRGLYLIRRKAKNPDWLVPRSNWTSPDMWGQVIPGGDPNNPIKARWLEIHDGVGIHGTADESSIGTRASHGCIRMTVADICDLYPRVRRNTPIYIV